MFVSVKTIKKVIFLTLISESVLAGTFILYPTVNGQSKRVNAVGTFIWSSLNENISTDSDVINFLKNSGLSVDSKSEVHIHEESNQVNLTCFMCTVNSVAPNFEMASPDNRDRRF